MTAIMVRRWVAGCGYRVDGHEENSGESADLAHSSSNSADSAADSGADSEDEDDAGHAAGRRQSAPPLSPRWADARGTLWPRGARPGLVDVRARPSAPHRVRTAPAEAARAPRRWPGFPGGPPLHATETRPAAYVAALVDQRDVFEPERLVGERRAADGTVEYRVRWKGYSPSQDTWEPLEHLQAGRRSLLRDWEKRRGHAVALRGH